MYELKTDENVRFDDTWWAYGVSQTKFENVSLTDVKLQHERLVTFSVDLKGSTTFRVSISSFFAWVLMILATTFQTLRLTAL